MTHSDLEQSILEHVGAAGYKPVKPRVIAKNLGLCDDAARNLKKAVKRLVRQGKLAYGQNHLVGLPAASDLKTTSNTTSNTASGANSNRVTGVFRRRQAGYGFVRPSHARPSDGRSQDIYVATKNARDASSGDVVLVRLHKQRPHQRERPGPSGEIIEIIERETHRFVGTYFERAGLALVQIDGEVFSRAILVGDPTASDAQINDKVVIEMVRFPSHVHDGEAVVIDVLGPRGDPGVDTMTIIHEFNLPGEFDEEVLDAARQQAETFDESIPEDRLDLTGETVITIDPADARDFDDAISLTKTAAGHWLLGVHIADVSHFVQPRTPLDQDARDRATSVYLPDQVIPMLPEIISNNLASLQPDRQRYTLTAQIEFTDSGTRVATDVHVAAIKSARRFTYEEVDQYLADRSAWRKKIKPEVHSLLGNMHSLAMILRRLRRERGSLELTMPELKIDLDKQGRVAGAHVVENTISHQIIEEFMLSANEAVAERLAEVPLLFLRRVHGAPDPRKLKALTEFVAELGFKTESLESRFAIQALLAQVKGQPQEHAVNYAVLRAMQKAVYSPEEEGHYALASECYCHFTSPIRRYPDLTVHRLIKALVAGHSPQQEIDRLFALGEHCSQREQRAEQAERDLIRLKVLSYFAERIGETMEGVVTGVQEFGLFIQGREIPAEGFVHVSALSDDYYRYDAASHTLSGHKTGNRFRLGDAVRVAIAHVDLDRRKLEFRMLGRLLKSAAQAESHKGKKPHTPRKKPIKTKKVKAKKVKARTAKASKTKKTKTRKATKKTPRKKTSRAPAKKPAKKRTKKRKR